MAKKCGTKKTATKTTTKKCGTKKTKKEKK